MIRSTSSTDITCKQRESTAAISALPQLTRHLSTQSTTHLVHLLQTIISHFQPVDDFPLDLSELQVLNLKPAAEGGVSVASALPPPPPPQLAVTHHPLQVADLVLGLVQELVLVALLLQQEECFPVRVNSHFKETL